MSEEEVKEEQNEAEEQQASTEESSPENEMIEISKKELDDLKSKIEAATELQEKMVRAAADYENAKKRLAKEREDYVRYTKENLLRDLLPVVDNFERALQHAKTSEESSGIVTGIEMVHKQMLEVLTGLGLKRIESVGKEFDPNFHEAIAYAKEPGKDQEILDEVEAGYMLGENLLRAAKVRVRVAEEAESKDEEAES